MQFINKLETTVHGWVKNVPHLPVAAQKWLAQNVWWIAAIGAVLSAIAALFTLIGIFRSAAFLNTSYALYFVNPSLAALAIVSGIVTLVFLIIEALLLAVAVKPLQSQQKKGWVLLFTLLLASAVFSVVNAVLTLSVGGFIVGILGAAIGLAIGGYFLFEIHSQFAHTTKHAKTTAKKA